MKPQLMSLLMGGITLLAVPASADDETINCTATPNCADLGYTKNADSCPDGGIKCPFDEDRMFCLRSADLGFRIKNDVKYGDYLYTDGTSSATYTKGKGMVGMVLRPHPGNPRHALVVMIPNQIALDEINTNVNQNVALSACSDGFGKGIFGTGKYMAGIGEVLEFITSYDYLNDKLRALYDGATNYHFFDSDFYLSSTAASQDKYYWLQYSYRVQAETISYAHGQFICVMYL